MAFRLNGLGFWFIVGELILAVLVFIMSVVGPARCNEEELKQHRLECPSEAYWRNFAPIATFAFVSIIINGAWMGVQVVRLCRWSILQHGGGDRVYQSGGDVTVVSFRITLPRFPFTIVLAVLYFIGATVAAVHLGELEKMLEKSEYKKPEHETLLKRLYPVSVWKTCVAFAFMATITYIVDTVVIFVIRPKYDGVPQDPSASPFDGLFGALPADPAPAR